MNGKRYVAVTVSSISDGLTEFRLEQVTDQVRHGWPVCSQD